MFRDHSTNLQYSARRREPHLERILSMAQSVNPLALSADDPTHPLSAAYACLLEHGLDGAGEALRLLVDQATLIEREAFIGVAAYERSQERRAHANGFKTKSMLTRMGKLSFSVPQVREGGFYPSALERGARSERAMNLALSEMYVQGMSTRKMIEVLQKLVRPEVAISSTQVSRCNAALDEGLAAWRHRPLDEPYVIFDARYERVRYANQHIDCAVLVALGVTATGHRRVLGVSVSVSEAEVHWREFMQGLLARGLCGVRYIVSDDHAGLRARRCSRPRLGSAVSFTCSTTRRGTWRAWTSALASPTRCARSLQPLIRLRPSGFWPVPSRGGAPSSPSSPPGPRPISPKALPCSRCPRRTECACEPPTDWSD
jgi:hypothetical protein